VGTVTVTATIAECSSYYTASGSVTVESTPVAPAVTAFSVGRANSFDGSYRDQISFSPTIYNPSGPSYPVTVTYSIAKTGSHGSIVYSDNSQHGKGCRRYLFRYMYGCQQYWQCYKECFCGYSADSYIQR
jgi:hypothetical protein